MSTKIKDFGFLLIVGAAIFTGLFLSSDESRIAPAKQNSPVSVKPVESKPPEVPFDSEVLIEEEEDNKPVTVTVEEVEVQVQQPVKETITYGRRRGILFRRPVFSSGGS